MRTWSDREVEYGERVGAILGQGEHKDDPVTLRGAIEDDAADVLFGGAGLDLWLVGANDFLLGVSRREAVLRV